MTDFKTPLVYATMAGCAAATAYVTYCMLTSSEEISSSSLSKD